ncbi:MAG: magnesium chelatase [Cytophagales bacterium]|nr:magnesium chelatase [Cytophagales bacterium]MDW8383325.1 magnesium chelatase [Flammeovirgaceae bacterium]
MEYQSIPFSQRLRLSKLAELKAVGYQPRSIKEEIRQNLIAKLKRREPIFEGIHGYEDTVIPDMQRALLSKHDIILLGLRGQAKTKMARLMVELLDEYIPYIAGTELNDDPFNPISALGKQLLAEKGDETPIAWLHRSERYFEKLATPDVTVADLIGDVDPIKAATLKLPYSDERVLHYGMIPRANRCIFVINELPDLQARIQVALFNILQEGDVQIRGFKLRLPLDIQFVFTANPEDYTNRGSIVTPLKDRIDSQILTHYPKSIEIGKKITQQEAEIKPEQKEKIFVPEIAKDLVELIAVVARESEFTDTKSGVSARLTISAYENLLSTAERRLLLNNESKTFVRVSDFWGVLPAITGKVELVYEGEVEGTGVVAVKLVGRAIKQQLLRYFPDPSAEMKKKGKTSNVYQPILDWFSLNNTLEILNDSSDKEYKSQLLRVEGLAHLVKQKYSQENEATQFFLMELLLHGLAEYALLSKQFLSVSTAFQDLLHKTFTQSETVHTSNKFLDEDDDDHFSTGRFR